jgi:hypothetical protein
MGGMRLKSPNALRTHAALAPQIRDRLKRIGGATFWRVMRSSKVSDVTETTGIILA